MIVVLSIVGILLLLLIIVLSLRVGVTVTLRDTLTITAHIGPKSFTVYPMPEKKEKPPKKKKASPASPTGKKQRVKLDLTAQDVREAIRAAWQAVERVLGRIGRRIRIEPCEASIVVGGPWPDKVAEQYGLISAAVWTVMPRLEQLIHICDPYIHLDVDFNAPGTEVEGQLGAYLRIGDLVAIAIAAAIPLLSFYFPFRRRQKARRAAAAANVPPTAAAQ